MNKKQLILTSLILLTANIVGLWQYIQIVNLDAASAVTASSTFSGHSWSTMECSATSLCIVNNNLGIAMGASKNPINNLDVNGSVAIGTSYAGVNTAPANGLIVQGTMAIGKTSVAAGKVLDVNGNILATDVCNSAGACLSQMASYIASQSANMIGAVHSQAQCTAAGGVVTSIAGAISPLCKFTAGSCPTGWNHFQNWGTINGGCVCVNAGHQYCGISQPGCGCGSTYPWGNTAQPVISCSSWDDLYVRGYTEIGCY